jgi:hypothetical protein
MMKMFLSHGERSGIRLSIAASGYENRKLKMSFSSSVDAPVAVASPSKAIHGSLAREKDVRSWSDAYAC